MWCLAIRRNFPYTLDAQTGELVSAPKRNFKTLAGKITPQGYLVKNGNKLLIPCGRSVAACLDLETDKFLSYGYGNRTNNYHLSSVGPYIFHGSSTYQMDTKTEFTISSGNPVLTEDVVYFGKGDSVYAYDLNELKSVETKDRRGKVVTKKVLNQRFKQTNSQLHEMSEEKYATWAKTNPVQIDLKAGNRLYGHQGSMVFAMDLSEDRSSASVSWSQVIAGTPATMIAANGSLVVVTKEGGLFCFSDKKTESRAFSGESIELTAKQDQWKEKTKKLLQHFQVTGGYCLILGAGSGRLIEELVQQSDLSIIAVEPDPKKVEQLRKKFDAAGLYGSRVVIHQGSPLSFGLPSYMAELIVSEDLTALDLSSDTAWKTLYNTVRPYGGKICLDLSQADYSQLTASIAGKQLAQADLKQIDGLAILTRVGSLPGSADWTHEYGDASNTLTSLDELVKAPLGVLWFGGPSGHGDLFYNRHFWGPSMAVIQGRMFIQGPGKLTAVDVYTGRILWQIPLAETKDNNLGRRGNDFEKIISGHHFLAVEDGIYLVTSENTCLRIDPVTGKTLAVFKLPKAGDSWGRIRVHKD
ncbi:MAG: hypothetical protein JKY95_19525 [Planctomycetaceae bacterium]|nr:hypothetical protein [Planctomycetaceae bacterium]